MRLKKGVSLVGLVPQLAVALQAAEPLWLDAGAELVITSGSEQDVRHGYTSLHYPGAALDLRTKNLPDKMVKIRIQQMLQEALGPDFDVVLENLGGPNEHMHIEWQPKRRI